MIFFFFYRSYDHRGLTLLTHSLPTRRSCYIRSLRDTDKNYVYININVKEKHCRKELSDANLPLDSRRSGDPQARLEIRTRRRGAALVARRRSRPHRLFQRAVVDLPGRREILHDRGAPLPRWRDRKSTRLNSSH